MESKSTGGLCTLEKEDHINVLELKTVLFGLKPLAKDLNPIHIKVLCDNSTAVTRLINLGPADLLNVILLPKKYEHGLPILQNFEDDLESRKEEIHTEWKLKESVFQCICRKN